VTVVCPKSPESNGVGVTVRIVIPFLSHHKARGNLFADWAAAGQGWIRNSIKFSSQRVGHQPGYRPDL
jgi:hypothetical protein